MMTMITMMLKAEFKKFVLETVVKCQLDVFGQQNLSLFCKNRKKWLDSKTHIILHAFYFF